MDHSFTEVARLIEKLNEMGWDKSLLRSLYQADARTYRVIERILNGTSAKEAHEEVSAIYTRRPNYLITVCDTMSCDDRVAIGKYKLVDASLAKAPPKIDVEQYGHWECELREITGGGIFLNPSDPWQEADMGHLLAFGVAYPDVQLKYCILARGLKNHLYQNYQYPALSSYNGERRLTLNSDKYMGYHRLLVVRKILIAQ